jgi:hypothetical protein
MIKVKIEIPDIQCEISISQDIDKNVSELDQLLDVFELALKGCGFELGDRKLKLTEYD